MAPTLLPRYYCNRYDDDCYSPWYDYGRWIVLAAVIVGAFLIFLIFACITARRRRRRGMQPYRGTGWAGGNVGPAPPYGGLPPQPYGQQSYGQQGPPVYSPPAQQGYGYNQYGGVNQGYFGGQQSGVELQQPNNAYQPQRGGDSVYDPSTGPMPAKQ